MFDRRTALKAIMAVAGGAVLPTPLRASAERAPTRQPNSFAPILIAIMRDGEMVAYQELPNATIVPEPEGIAIYGDPAVFPLGGERVDGVNVLILLAPDVPLIIPCPTIGLPDWPIDGTLTLEYPGAVARLWGI